MRRSADSAFRITYDPKKFFFDRTIVVVTLSDVNRAYLNRVGGSIRKTAQRSMKPGKTATRNYRAGKNRKRAVHVGQRLHAPENVAPRYWSGDLRHGAHGILYHMHPSGKPLVLIGPVPRRGSRVPEILEFGGTTVTTRWDPVRKRIYKVRIRIGKHPYMKPAYDKNVKNFPKWWAQVWGRFARLRRKGLA